MNMNLSVRNVGILLKKLKKTDSEKNKYGENLKHGRLGHPLIYYGQLLFKELLLFKFFS